MKKLLLLVAIFASAKVYYCFEVKRIKGIQGSIKTIDFDSNFNCYVVAYLNDAHYFHKIDSDKNVLLTQKFDNIEEVIINSKNDVYIFERIEAGRPMYDGNSDNKFNFWDANQKLKNTYTVPKSGHNTTTTTTTPSPIAYTKNTIWIMRSQMKKATKLYYWEGGENPKLFLDSQDYLFVSTTYGLILFKPDQNIPFSLIEKNYQPFGFFANDLLGNVYLNTDSSVLAISKHQKLELISSFREYDLKGYFKSDYLTINSIGADDRGSIYCATKSDGASAKANITKLSPYDYRKMNVLHSQFDTSFNFIYAVKDRLYFTSDISGKFFSIFFVNSKPKKLNYGYLDHEWAEKENKIVAIEELFEYPLITNDKNLCSADFSGNAFFALDKVILSIKHDETQVTRINSPSLKKISSILVDKDDNLWVLAEDLFFYKNGTTDAIWVAALLGEENSPMKENKKTGEVYVGSKTGLSAVLNDDF